MPTACLDDVLLHALHDANPPALCVAYSGGPDSTALLHALAQLPAARARGLHAVHIDHGLHPDSGRWAAHCQRFCEALEVPLSSVSVHVDDSRGEGIEAAARHARRAAFAEALRVNEWLALAHHRDDQIETVMLKLLRGAGPEGLGGMHTLRPFGPGSLWRPLLDLPRATLRDYVAAHDLPHIDDPANDDPRFSRNVLRAEILPRIDAHWPHAGAAILHAAQLCRIAAAHLAREAEAAVGELRRADETLDADGWLALPRAVRVPALHQWLRERGLPIPSDAQSRQLQQQAAQAAEDALPCVTWPGAEVRIWDGRLHATPPLAETPVEWAAAWHGEALRLPKDCGTLAAVPHTPGALPPPATFNPPLRVRLRRGGERIRPAGDPHTRELRDLFQQARMPPWLRERCPLIHADDELIAVGDSWISERGMAFFEALGLRPCWHRPPWAARSG
jgi:tRNA(Ile)-lysidine synthase